MTGLIAFENLTWPDVAALPRQLPLVIPLGAGYELSGLASLLNDPDQIGLLPAHPLWLAGQPAAVAHPLLADMLDNLFGSLGEDGFTRVFLLAPPGLEKFCIKKCQ